MRTLKNKISAERHLIKKCTKPKYFKKKLIYYSECFKKKLSPNKHENHISIISAQKIVLYNTNFL